jgi:hypothetical protein
MQKYTFKYEEAMSPSEIKTAIKTANLALQMGVPQEFCEAAMWQFAVSKYVSPRSLAIALHNFYKEVYNGR